MYFLLVFSLLISKASFASEIWKQAGSLKELQFQAQQAELKKELKMACLFQIKTEKIPNTCYTWLSLQNHSKKNEVKSYLDEKCMRAVSNIKKLPKIKKILNNKHLSNPCRKWTKRQKAILEYQLRDGAAESLFQWYLQ